MKRTCAFVVLLCLFAMSWAQAGELRRQQDRQRAIPGKYIVVLKDKTADSVGIASSHAAVYGFRQKHVYRGVFRGYSAEMSAAQAEALANDPEVEAVEEDFVVSIDTTQSGATWGIDRIDQRNLPLSGTYTYNVDGSGVNAYIIDTGIFAGHSEFAGRIGNGADFVGDGQGTNDCNGHGTHVAGTVGGTTYGVAKRVTLHAVRVLGCDGSGSGSGVIAGIDWVRMNRVLPAVANMSLGGGASSAEDNAVTNAVNAGVVFAVAAGNDNADACGGSPARAPAAITVGATTSGDARASFSNWGTCVDIFAPGQGITSSWNNGGTNTISGTSMASPHVAGAAALYLAQFPGSSAAAVAQGLINNSTPNIVTNAGSGSPNRLLYTLFGGGTTPTATRTATPTGTRTATPTSTPTGGSGCWAAWNAATQYNGGAQVSRICNGVTENFEAAFWTQGNDPCTNRNTGGNGLPWFPKGVCGGSATPTATATRTPTATTGTPGATPTRTATATATRTATATPTTGGACAGVPAFASCTAYTNGARVVYNSALYHSIAAVPATRDCPPNSPFNPGNDNWWVNDGGC